MLFGHVKVPLGPASGRMYYGYYYYYTINFDLEIINMLTLFLLFYLEYPPFWLVQSAHALALKYEFKAIFVTRQTFFIDGQLYIFAQLDFTL